MDLALEGVRVIDFTQVVAGPYATLQLSLMGADVIKVEQPRSGDLMRRVMAEGIFLEHGVSPVFQNLNIAKRSLTLDLKAADTADILRQLVCDADVIVENFRPGVMARLGLDYPTISKSNPSVIYCSVSGYGQSGLKSKMAAYDGPIQAETGIMSVNGHADGDPTRVGFWAIDAMTGMNAAMAIMAALFRKSTTGKGALIDVAMIDSAINLLSPQIIEFLNAGHVPGRVGNMTAAGLPTDNVFPTADGNIQITAINERQVAALFDVLDLQNLYQDAAFSNAEARLANAGKVHDALAAVLSKETAMVWADRLTAQGIPCSPVQSIPDFLVQPQAGHRKSIVDVAPPGNLDRKPIKGVNAGYRAEFCVRDFPAAPLLGEHTHNILRELGYSDQQQAAWRSKGVI